MTTVYQIDPIRDPRWGEFVEKHPRASVFHTPEWLKALQRTYGYEPVVYTTTRPGVEVTDGVVLCRIYSRITGRRMVSLPFSDHCEPLVGRPDSLECLLHSLELDCAKEGWKYVEIRPRTIDGDVPAGLKVAQTFHLHTIDLTPELGEIFRRFHRTSVRGMIRRAEREGLTYEDGRSEALLGYFYQLLLMTRRRQQLPPQPRDWFRNLLDCLGDKAKIRIASKDGQPIAGIVTLSFGAVLVYKYGCSDERFHQLGGMHLLFWNAIQEAKKNGVREYDLGRSDSDNSGLITFKERWGAVGSQLTYLRYSARQDPAFAAGWRVQVAKRILNLLPNSLMTAIGNAFYRHLG